MECTEITLKLISSDAEEKKIFSFTLSLSPATKVKEDAISLKAKSERSLLRFKMHHTEPAVVFLELTHGRSSLTSTETKNNHLITKLSCL